MPIQALPPSTVRALGSLQSLINPTSAVKELLENALDARASAILVELSANTLDTIHVRDNGHGVAPEDRHLIARRHCTSKIRDLDQLRDVGGTTLGFRGVALASIAEVSEALTVMTRVEGEDVAVQMEFERDGEIKRQERASHPVGTTVRIKNFLHAYPVRRQSALKEAAKTLTAVKHLIQAYALTRPTIRFSLRVSKTKNSKVDFTYASKSGAGVEEAVLQIFGKDCASQCAVHVLSFEGFELRACLPKPDADCVKISGKGQFVSIDSRPVLSTRGIGKDLVTVYKESLKKAGSQLEKARDPFLALDVGCPTRSYDVNVEPAKDDVAFAEPSTLQQAMDKLLTAAYHPPENDSTGSNRVSLGVEEHQRLCSELSIQVHEDANSNELHSSPKSQIISRSNMYNDYEEDNFVASSSAHASESDGDADEAEGQTSRDCRLSNPWVIAKLNATRKAQDEGSAGSHLTTPLEERRVARLNSKPCTDFAAREIQTGRALPTPQNSSPPPVSSQIRGPLSSGLITSNSSPHHLAVSNRGSRNYEKTLPIVAAADELCSSFAHGDRTRTATRSGMGRQTTLSRQTQVLEQSPPSLVEKQSRKARLSQRKPPTQGSQATRSEIQPRSARRLGHHPRNENGDVRDSFLPLSDPSSYSYSDPGTVHSDNQVSQSSSNTFKDRRSAPDLRCASQTPTRRGRRNQFNESAGSAKLGQLKQLRFSSQRSDIMDGQSAAELDDNDSNANDLRTQLTKGRHRPHFTDNMAIKMSLERPTLRTQNLILTLSFGTSILKKPLQATLTPAFATLPTNHEICLWSWQLETKLDTHSKEEWAHLLVTAFERHISR